MSINGGRNDNSTFNKRMNIISFMHKINFEIFEDIISDDDTIKDHLNGQKKLKIKWGADPSAPDLHLGHYVILNQLAQLNKTGTKLFLLLGFYCKNWRPNWQICNTKTINRGRC